MREGSLVGQGPLAVVVSLAVMMREWSLQEEALLYRGSQVALQIYHWAVQNYKESNQVCEKDNSTCTSL